MYFLNLILMPYRSVPVCQAATAMRCVQNESLHLTLPDAPTVMLSSMMQWTVDLRCPMML